MTGGAGASSSARIGALGAAALLCAAGVVWGSRVLPVAPPMRRPITVLAAVAAAGMGMIGLLWIAAFVEPSLVWLAVLVGPVLTLVRLITAVVVGALVLAIIRLDALDAAARRFFIAALVAGALGYLVPMLGMVVPITAGVVFGMNVACVMFVDQTRSACGSRRCWWRAR